MDISSTLIGMGMLFLFVGPIIFLIYSQKQNYTRLNKLLNQKSEEYSIKPDTTELTPTILLGLDATLKKLLYVYPEHKQAMIVSLSDIKDCGIKKVNFKDLPGSINFVSLILNFKKREEPAVEIVFYNENDDSTPDSGAQLQLANKWEKIISRHL